MSKKDRVGEELIKQEIDAIIGAFDKVPCLDRPDKYSCSQECPHYYDAAGALAVISKRDKVSLEKAVKRLKNNYEKLDSIGRANYKNELEKVVSTWVTA